MGRGGPPVTTYNKYKTAYLHNGDMSSVWCLIPRGRSTAPRLWQMHGPTLPSSAHHVPDAITPEDRMALLEAYDAGVLHKLWDMLWPYLKERSDRMYAMDNLEEVKKAEKILDKYLGS